MCPGFEKSLDLPSISQTWHQAAITQLKHFLFYDNFYHFQTSTFSILLKILGLLVSRSNVVLKYTYFKIDSPLTPANKPG